MQSQPALVAYADAYDLARQGCRSLWNILPDGADLLTLSRERIGQAAEAGSSIARIELLMKYEHQAFVAMSNQKFEMHRK